MAYIALYRSCRPQQFREIVGQTHISQTLKNAVIQERVAHAYLFCGPRGTGKTSTAKVLAKAVNCLAGDNGEPCNQCGLCVSINNSLAYDIIEIDGASNRGIDEIRDLKEKVKLSPTEAKFKVYIIDEVHMLTTEAFNALLKTLEEPPDHVIFVLATTEPHKVPLTILSRCQRFDFRRITNKIILEHLKQIAEENSISVDEKALFLIAKAADGGMRDALSLLDQAITFGGQQVTWEHVTTVIGTVKEQTLLDAADCIIRKDSNGMIRIINELSATGKDLGQFIWGMLEHFRNLLLLKDEGNKDILVIAPDLLPDSEQQADKFDQDELFQIIETLAQLEKELKWTVNPKILIEVTGVRLCRGLGGTSTESLLTRIKQLERQLAGGGYAKADSQQVKQIILAEEKASLKQNYNEKDQKDEKAEKDKNDKNDKKDKLKIVAPMTGIQTKDAVVASAAISVEQVVSKWKDVLTLVKKTKIATHAFLVEAKPAYLEGNKLIIEFDKGFSFHCEKIQQADNKSILESALQKCFQVEMSVTCQMKGEDNKTDQGFEDDIKKAVKLFGKDVVEIQDN